VRCSIHLGITIARKLSVAVPNTDCYLGILGDLPRIWNGKVGISLKGKLTPIFPLFFVLFIASFAGCFGGTVPLAPGAGQVKLTTSSDDVKTCTAVGNIDGRIQAGSIRSDEKSGGRSWREHRIEYNGDQYWMEGHHLSLWAIVGLTAIKKEGCQLKSPS
jgi:hypothetical protein